MIHLDTNILIDCINHDSPANERVVDKLRGGLTLCCSAVVWTEFCNGPCTKEQIEDLLQVIQSTILPFDRKQAELASTLFNATGRSRTRKADCMIAACAINANASILTYNTSDFEKFTPHGLKLEPLSAA